MLSFHLQEVEELGSIGLQTCLHSFFRISGRIILMCLVIDAFTPSVYEGLFYTHFFSLHSKEKIGALRSGAHAGHILSCEITQLANNSFRTASNTRTMCVIAPSRWNQNFMIYAHSVWLEIIPKCIFDNVQQ